MSEQEAPGATLARALGVLGARRTIAVLGVSRDPERYGHELFAILRERHHVYPVNPKVEEIDGLRCYSSLAELPEWPEIIVLALGPAVTEKVVPSCLDRGAVIWLPPGCFTERAVNLAREGGAEVVADICPLFVTRRLQATQG